MNRKTNKRNVTNPVDAPDLTEISDSLEEIKEQLDCLGEIRKKMEALEGFMLELRHLKEENAEKDQKIKALTSRVEELEQHDKLNDVIITGLVIKPRSYARATASDREELDDADVQSVEQQVGEFLKSKDIDLKLENVDTCHLLPLKKGNDTRANGTRAVVLRFTGRKHKVALLKQGRKLKGTKVFINENLSKHNATIAWKARQLRKSGSIQSTWTANCKIYVKPKGSSPENTKPVLIRAVEELDKFTQ